jgi:hypothetical protein
VIKLLAELSSALRNRYLPACIFHPLRVIRAGWQECRLVPFLSTAEIDTNGPHGRS